MLLRQLVLSTDFWPRGLGATYGPEARTNTANVNAYAARYARAAGAAGWERGLLTFVAARAEQVVGAALSGESLEARLAHALASDAPLDRVLIINGAADPIVPVANARRLAGNLRAAAPAAVIEFVAVAGAGHCPHEEGDVAREIGRVIANF